MILSIIIPVFNIKDYIIQCVKSLICPNYDYEIILVDDGSTDGSGELCEQFATNYTFIRVLHKLNGGVSSARNLGIHEAKGKYVYFVDGDDFVNDIDKLLYFLQNNEIECAAVNYYVLGKNDNVLRLKKYAFEKISILKFHQYQDRHFHAPWGYIYRRNLLIKNKILFSTDLKYAEDWVFVTYYLAKVKEITTIPGVFYNYRACRTGSAMNKKYNRTQVLLYFRAYDLIKAIKPIDENLEYVKREQRELFSYLLNVVSCNRNILDLSYVQKLIRKRLELSSFVCLDVKFILKALIAYINIKLL